MALLYYMTIILHILTLASAVQQSGNVRMVRALLEGGADPKQLLA